MKFRGAVFLAIGLLAPAHASPPLEPTTLVLVEWDDEENVRSPEGCDEPDIICMDVEADVSLRVLQHYSGKRLPDEFQAAVVYHSTPSPRTRILLAVQRDEQRSLRAYILDYVSAGEKLACFSDSETQGLHVIVPRSATRIDDNHCVRAAR